jgi:hypothetical protein
MTRSATSPLTRQQRWWVWLCLVGVLGFQAMGLVHRTQHGGAVAQPVRIVLAMATLVAPADGARALPVEVGDIADVVGISDALDVSVDAVKLSFGHVAGSSDCQLLDQLSQALSPIVQALAWTALLPDFPVAGPQPHDASLAQVWRKAARAPPLA